jgi:hypothetical protein
MTDHDQSAPRPARGAQVRTDVKDSTLTLVRELRHPPRKVWPAQIGPSPLRERTPSEAGRSRFAGVRRLYA